MAGARAARAASAAAGARGAREVAVTFIGHSTFLIRTASTVIITDPVFTSHAGPFGRMGPRARAAARRSPPLGAAAGRSGPRQP